MSLKLEQVSRGQIVSWIRTCGLYPEDSGQSMYDLNLDRHVIRVTCLMTILASSEKELKTGESRC